MQWGSKFCWKFLCIGGSIIYKLQTQITQCQWLIIDDNICSLLENYLNNNVIDKINLTLKKMMVHALLLSLPYSKSVIKLLFLYFLTTVTLKELQGRWQNGCDIQKMWSDRGEGCLCPDRQDSLPFLNVQDSWNRNVLLLWKIGESLVLGRYLGK